MSVTKYQEEVVDDVPAEQSTLVVTEAEEIIVMMKHGMRLRNNLLLI